MIEIFWLSNHDSIDAIGPWDTGLLRRLFEGKLWPTAAEFVSSYRTEWEIPDRAEGERAVVVLPAAHHHHDIEWLNTELAKLSGVVLVLCGDEGGGFPWREVVHPNIRWWVQAPDPAWYGDTADWAYFFGWGYRYEFPDWAKRYVPRHGKRPFPWGFSGQVTNAARKRAANGLRKTQRRLPGALFETRGFALGVTGEEYAKQLADVWIAPCPSGPLSIDSFRFYEALESGCIPFVDGRDITGTTSNYWHMMYAGWDGVEILDWETVGGVIEYEARRAPLNSAYASAWWQRAKRDMVKRMENDLRGVGAEVKPWTQLTAIVTTSPVASNPSLDMIMETLRSIPACEVIIACDNVRPEQQHMEADYAEFLYRLAAWCEHDAVAAVPVIIDRWSHQAALTGHALTMVDTPTVLFMEHDTPLVTDMAIDWEGCVELVANEHLDVIRFHHESRILPVHKYLMVDLETRTMLGVPIRRTKQWSQRPALYSTDYFRRILRDHFSADARCFIEDKMHSVAQVKRGHRLAIYHPNGNIQRSYHLDGRCGGPKYEDSQVF